MELSGVRRLDLGPAGHPRVLILPLLQLVNPATFKLIKGGPSGLCESLSLWSPVFFIHMLQRIKNKHR